MIPKILHYIWLGNNPIPAELIECIDSWKKYMPDWETRKWDDETIKSIESDWLKETLSEKKFAFASDFIRMFALYNYGGIYLDTDVKVFKSFDSLLNNPAFIGRESCLHIKGYLKTCVDLTSYCFGAEKGNPYIKRCLEYYEGRKFILSKNENLPIEFRYSQINLSYIMCEIAKTLGYKDTLLSPQLQKLPELTVYPSTFFNNEKKTNDTYCQHLSYGSWRGNHLDPINYNWKYKIYWRLKNVLQKISDVFGYIIIEKI